MIQTKLDYQAAKQYFAPDIVRKAAKSALNKTATSTRMYASKSIRARYNVPAGEVKDNVSIT